MRTSFAFMGHAFLFFVCAMIAIASGNACGWERTGLAALAVTGGFVNGWCLSHWLVKGDE